MVGYAFAFGEGNPYIGLTHFAGQGLTFGNYGMVFFQVMLFQKYGFIGNFELNTSVVSGKMYFINSAYLHMYAYAL